ncbi:MAG TPA: phosphatase PAP2 family protein [Candidatus Saccharimonadales bacterium]|nr:phosphatase PAP2 family protein [Candidatus Saccharimonadales bacterium]
MSIITRFDRTITKAIKSLPDTYRPAATAVSFIGTPWVVVAVSLAGLLSVLNLGRPAEERVFLYAIAAYLFNTLLKFILRRQRPFGRVIKMFGVRSYSLPSGHAFGTLIFYGLFAYLDLRYSYSFMSLVIAAILAVCILAVGVSRVYLGVHYPSDVVAGWLLGAVSLYIVVAAAF